MFWNDIKEIKNRLEVKDENEKILYDRICQCEVYLAEKLNCLEEKVNKLDEEIPRFAALSNPAEILEKYEKHILKIEKMLLEFKGCISISRAALDKRKKEDKNL